MRSKVHVPKALFRGSHSDPWSKAGDPALRLRLFCADFQSVPACTTPVLLQVLQCLALPIYFTQSLYGLSLSRLRQMLAFCFLSILQLLETLRIPKRFYPLYLSKGLGLKREGENPPSLFCVFGSFCHITKGTSLLFLLEKE